MIKNNFNPLTDVIPVISQEEDIFIVVSPYDMREIDQQFAAYYKKLGKHPDVQKVAAHFLNQSYRFEALGEGEKGRYAQEPLYRTDQFDCVTYVDTVLSLFYASDLLAFKENMLCIRYLGGIPDYAKRTDWFTDLEWIPNAQRLGWIQDVTLEMVDNQKKPLAQIATTLIDKPNWYQVKPFKVIHLLQPLPSKEKAEALLQQLRLEGKNFQAAQSELSYLPLNKLFNREGEPLLYLFDQIPSAAVIAIVRPDWPIHDNFPGFPKGYGTNLNVSHLGIAIRSPSGLLFYHAARLQQKVVCEPLTQYLQKYLDSPTIKGIHIEKITAV